MNKPAVELPELLSFQSILGLLMNDLVSVMAQSEPEALKAILARHEGNAHGDLLIHISTALSVLIAADHKEIDQGDLINFYYMLKGLADAGRVLSSAESNIEYARACAAISAGAKQ